MKGRPDRAEQFKGFVRAFADVPEPDRRHPAEVTAARLLKHVEDYHDDFTPAERDAVATVRTRLLDIADKRRR